MGCCPRVALGPPCSSLPSSITGRVEPTGRIDDSAVPLSALRPSHAWSRGIPGSWGRCLVRQPLTGCGLFTFPLISRLAQCQKRPKVQSLWCTDQAHSSWTWLGPPVTWTMTTSSTDAFVMSRTSLETPCPLAGVVSSVTSHEGSRGSHRLEITNIRCSQSPTHFSLSQKDLAV